MYGITYEPDLKKSVSRAFAEGSERLTSLTERSVANVFQSLCSSHERLHNLPSTPETGAKIHSHFSSSESNPAPDECLGEGQGSGPRPSMLRPRSRSLRYFTVWIDVLCCWFCLVTDCFTAFHWLKSNL